jgi:hypothetical protein
MRQVSRRSAPERSESPVVSVASAAPSAGVQRDTRPCAASNRVRPAQRHTTLPENYLRQAGPGVFNRPFGRSRFASSAGRFIPTRQSGGGSRCSSPSAAGSPRVG